MRCLSFLAAALVALPLAAQEPLELPSGRVVVLQEILWDSEGAVSRFRFVAPWAATADAGGVLDDMTALCHGFALPVQQALYPDAGEVVISFASEPAEFGVMNAEIVQFFEGFTTEGTDCIWNGH